MPFIIWCSDQPFDFSGRTDQALKSVTQETEADAIRRAKAIEDCGHCVLHMQRDDGTFTSRIELAQIWSEP